MHPSYLRLLNCAREATSKTPAPIRDSADLGAYIKASPQKLHGWKKRGVSKHGAMMAQQVFGCTFSYVLEGTQPQWMPKTTGDSSEGGHNRPPSTGEPPSDWTIPSTPEKASLSSEMAPGTSFVSAPVVAWADLEAVLMKPNREWPEEAFLTSWALVPKASENTKFARVIESKIPTISPGDVVGIDPRAEPKDDAVVLAKTSNGRIGLYRYRSLATGGWEAFVPDEPPLESARHGLKLLGVVISLVKGRI